MKTAHDLVVEAKKSVQEISVRRHLKPSNLVMC